MPRLMSVSLTEQQVRARTKTVTRRVGWLMLKPGDRLTLCRKVMGWVTDPEIGLTRPQQLKAIGNGVIPSQAVAAFRYLFTLRSEVA